MNASIKALVKAAQDTAESLSKRHPPAECKVSPCEICAAIARLSFALLDVRNAQIAKCARHGQALAASAARRVAEEES